MSPINKMKYSFSLADNMSRNMNRDQSVDVLGDFLDDNIAGLLNKGPVLIISFK